MLPVCAFFGPDPKHLNRLTLCFNYAFDTASIVAMMLAVSSKMKRLISLLAVSAIAAGSGNAQNDPALPRLPKPIIVAEALASKLVKLENTTLVAHALDPEKAIDHFLFYY